MDIELTKKAAKAIITLCVDEGLKQGVVTASEFEELLDYLDEMNENYQEKLDIGYMHEKSQFTEEKQCYSEKDRKYNPHVD